MKTMTLAALPLVATLAACGGGGSGTTPTAPSAEARAQKHYDAVSAAFAAPGLPAASVPVSGSAVYAGSLAITMPAISVDAAAAGDAVIDVDYAAATMTGGATDFVAMRFDPVTGDIVETREADIEIGLEGSFAGSTGTLNVTGMAGGTEPITGSISTEFAGGTGDALLGSGTGMSDGQPLEFWLATEK